MTCPSGESPIGEIRNKWRGFEQANSPWQLLLKIAGENAYRDLATG
jgi:hypothetical protein